MCSSSRQPWIWFQVTFLCHGAFRLTFQFGPSNAAGRVPQHCRRCSPRNTQPFPFFSFFFLLQKTRIKIPNIEGSSELQSNALPLRTATAQPTVSNTWCVAARFHRHIILNHLKWVSSHNAFCKFYCTNNFLPCVRNNINELLGKLKSQQTFTPHLLRGEKNEQKKNKTKTPSPCHALNLR